MQREGYTNSTVASHQGESLKWNLQVQKVSGQVRAPKCFQDFIFTL